MDLAVSRDIMVEDLYSEVTEIMHDPTIEIESNTSYIISTARLRVATDLLARTFTPVVLKLYYLYLRNQQFLVSNARIIPALFAFIANGVSTSLASVHKHIPRRAIANGSERDLDGDYTHATSLAPEASVHCQVLYTPTAATDITADVIFIHGLHGGLTKTWKQGTWRHRGHKLKNQKPVRRKSTGNLYIPARKDSLKRTISDIYTTTTTREVPGRESDWELMEEEEEEGAYSNCWPRDWIGQDCPNTRVIALNYTTDILWCPVWKKKRNRTDMVERSDEMITELLQLGVGQKPIIWVGHSKGGLFIKQIVLNAFERRGGHPHVFQICANTKGILFYSVPHKGSALADITLPLLRRSVELIEIQRNCHFVLELHRKFLQLCNDGHLDAEVFSFIETSFTLMSFVYLKIVAYESADPGVGVKCDVPLDHREICKPAGRDCFLYLELIKFIEKYSVH